jgi:leucyl aminopeptidase
MTETHASFPFTDDPDGTAPIYLVDGDALDGLAAVHGERAARWAQASNFKGKANSFCLVPDEAGGLGMVLCGNNPDAPAIWALAHLPRRLPPGAYRLEAGDAAVAAHDLAHDFALGWALGAYRFDLYKSKREEPATLAWPAGVDQARVTATAQSICLARDLINTPAQDLTPAALQEALETVGAAHGATVSTITGDNLLKQNYPAIHAVGRAAADAPRLIDLRWGDESAPKVTLVGKGVCFDSGGLDVKPAAGMRLMKKDMGGAATVAGLANLIMATGLPVRLRVLIPAVENAIAGNAYHPMDVIRARNGKTIEIGHTDAEGRVILADALVEASSEAPDLLLDFATLTGAARVALGPDLPALFTDDDELADALLGAGITAADPLWRLPLWDGYRKMIDGETADITNSAESPFGGAITAALFLKEFVETDTAWAHIDTFGWTSKAKPGRPKGGEALGLRAAYNVIKSRFGENQ